MKAEHESDRTPDETLADEWLEACNDYADIYGETEDAKAVFAAGDALAKRLRELAADNDSREAYRTGFLDGLADARWTGAYSPEQQRKEAEQRAKAYADARQQPAQRDVE